MVPKGRQTSKIFDIDSHYPLSTFLAKTKHEFSIIANQFTTEDQHEDAPHNGPVTSDSGTTSEDYTHGTFA
jgi:hypothetical protein